MATKQTPAKAWAGSLVGALGVALPQVPATASIEEALVVLIQTAVGAMVGWIITYLSPRNRDIT